MSIITDPLNPLKTARMEITSNRGVPFMILVDVAADLVEFWDLRFPMPHFNMEVRERMGGADMPGQFVTRHDIETIARPGYESSHWSPLVLDGGVENWQIDGGAMSLVRRWMRFTCDRATTTEESGT